MRKREDISKFLIDSLKYNNTTCDYSVYEQNGLLYMANYNDDFKKLLYYSEYTIIEKSYKDMIERKFNVTFARKKDDIICKCGESKCFSAYYGDYEIFLKCNKCGNKFSAYQG